MKPELRYYAVTLFKTAKEVLISPQLAELQAHFGRFQLQCSSIFRFRAAYREKSRF